MDAFVGEDAPLPFDAGVDAPSDAFVPDCTPWEYRGCSHSADQWYWNGVDCEQIFECADSGFATRRACVDAHVGCEPIDCGVALELGSNEVRAVHVENAPTSADVCRAGSGAFWLARGSFTAPASGIYRIRSWPYLAWPPPIDIAVLRGGCGDRVLACGIPEHGQAEVRLQAGDTITVLAKPEYDTESAEFFFAMDVSIRLVSD